MYLVLSDDSTPQFIMISKELGGPNTILIHCISNPCKYLLKTGYFCFLNNRGLRRYPHAIPTLFSHLNDVIMELKIVV